FMHQPTIDVVQVDTLNYISIQNQLFDFSRRLNKLQVLDRLRTLANQAKGEVAWEFVDIEIGDSPTGLFQISHMVPINELMKYNFQTHFFDELYVLNESGQVLWPGDSKGIQLI